MNLVELAAGKVVPNKNWSDALGFRVRIELDDHSRLFGRLVSLSANGNLVLTDVEREVRLKRRRDENGHHRFRRETYGTVLYVRGSAVVSLHLNKNVITDPNVVDSIGVSGNAFGAAAAGGSRVGDEAMSHVIQVANMKPQVPL